MKENIVIIAENSKKKKILMKLSRSKLLYNIKFLTFKELKKKIFFDYDNKTLEYVMKNYNVGLSVARIYLDNLYFLKDINYKKVQFLIDLKKDLEDKNLLILDHNFKDWINNKKVIVYGYKKFSKEQEILLNSLEVNYEIKDDNLKQCMPVVYEAKTMEDEAQFVVTKISELLSKKIDINKIKLVISSDYRNVVIRYFRLFNIPINMDSLSSFYSTILAQDFLKNYDNLDIADNILLLREKYSNVNDLVNIINRSVLVENKELRKEFIIEDLKNCKVKPKVYDKAVSICDLEEIEEDDYAFIMGFNINFYPKVFRDEEYLSDEIKEALGIDISSYKNMIAKEYIKDVILSLPNLYLTYKLSSAKGVFYPSLLIQEMGLRVETIEMEAAVSFSKIWSKIKYAQDLDNFYKFNVIGDNLGLYKNSLRIDYREYNNEFSGINNDFYKESLGNELSLAYTNMEMYNECAFRYYLTKVLKIDLFEESFKTIIGNIVHHILELGLKKDIDINVEIIKFIKEKDYVLTSREYFYLEMLSEDIKKILRVIKKQSLHSKLNKYLFENEFYVYKDRQDINVSFKGLIDKVMYADINGKEFIMVVDYKTGSTLVTLDNLEYGLNIQLPIYLYLLKNSERFKDAVIAGFYVQKVLDSVPSIVDGKSINELREENMRLQGYSNSSNSILELIDDEYQDSKIIKGLRFKTNGELYSSAKVLSSKDMDDLTVKVDLKIEECISNILEGKFDINPKVINNKNISCTYCKFKDICFKCKKDEIVLGGEVDELDEGTGVSN